MISRRSILALFGLAPVAAAAAKVAPAAADDTLLEEVTFRHPAFETDRVYDVFVWHDGNGRAFWRVDVDVLLSEGRIEPGPSGAVIDVSRDGTLIASHSVSYPCAGVQIMGLDYPGLREAVYRAAARAV